MSLARTHTGWENEHLATFLLSRIAFVASPIKVADDVGTDIFCTLYERQSRGGVPVLTPRSSIAVQIKSTSKPFDISRQLEYLARLEVPYYIGVVNQLELTLTLYSVRFLPLLLSFRGRHSRLDLLLVDEFERDYRPGNDTDGYKLLCPKVVTLSASDTKATAASLIQLDAAAALKAIASRMNKEYIFDIPGGDVEIYMGRDSATTFRESFYKRLAEALLNIVWLLRSNRSVPDAEIEAYMNTYEGLAAIADLPDYVRKAYALLVATRTAAA